MNLTSHHFGFGVALLVLLGANFATADEVNVRAQVSGVKDGNTFVARTEANVTRIYQLLAAVAPRKSAGQPGWREAQEKLEELINGKWIRLRTLQLGDQTYAVVYQGGANVNLGMIEAGHAWFRAEHIRGGPFAGAEPHLAAAQERASLARRGIWAREPAPIAPWEFETFLRDEAKRRLAAAGPPWSIAPKTTGAMSIVSNMESFSNKLDQVALSMGLPQPGVLDYAIRISGFDVGLFREGPLMWWFDPTTRAETYVIPALDGTTLIRERLGRYEPYMSGIIERESYQAFAFENYALFGKNKPWLQQCAESEGGLDAELSELSPFLSRQDIALAARDSVAELPFDRLPFSKGDGVISKALESTGVVIQQFMPGFTNSKHFAAGTELLPPHGARVSLAAAVDKESAAATWPESMTCGRDMLLGQLPDVSPGLLLALSSCDSWNEALTQLFDDPIGSPIEFADLRGLTLMVYPFLNPETDNPLAVFRADIQIENADRSLKRLQSYLEAMFSNANESDTWKCELTAVEWEGRRVLEITISSEREKEFPEPLRLCITAMDDKWLIIQGGAQKQLQATIANPNERPRLVDAELVKPALELLSNDAQQLMLLDLPNCYRLASQVLVKLSSEGNAFASLFNVDQDKKVPPIAASGRFSPTVIELNVAAPTATLKYLANPEGPISYQMILRLLGLVAKP